MALIHLVSRELTAISASPGLGKGLGPAGPHENRIHGFMRNGAAGIGCEDSVSKTSAPTS